MTVSVSAMESEIAAYRNIAEATRSDFRRTREAIVNDPMRSDLAKSQEVAAARDFANSRIEEAWRKERQYLADSRERVERAAFSIGFSPSTTDIVALRDAEDRVAKVDDERQALSMYERAKQIGDKTMISALVSHAHRSGMSNVLEAHMQNDVSLSRHLDSMRFLSNSESLESQMRSGIAYSPVSDRY